MLWYFRKYRTNRDDSIVVYRQRSANCFTAFGYWHSVALTKTRRNVTKGYNKLNNLIRINGKTGWQNCKCSAVRPWRAAALPFFKTWDNLIYKLCTKRIIGQGFSNVSISKLVYSSWSWLQRASPLPLLVLAKCSANLAAMEDSSANPLTLQVVAFLSPNVDRQHFQKSVPVFFL